MSPKDAEEIVLNYGDILAANPQIAKDESILPCSKEEIWRAYFIYIHDLGKKGNLVPGFANTLIQTYSALDTFMPKEEAEWLLSAHRKISDKSISQDTEQGRKIIDDYVMMTSKSMISVERMQDVVDLIGNYLDIDEIITEQPPRHTRKENIVTDQLLGIFIILFPSLLFCLIIIIALANA